MADTLAYSHWLYSPAGSWLIEYRSFSRLDVDILDHQFLNLLSPPLWEPETMYTVLLDIRHLADFILRKLMRGLSSLEVFGS